MMEKYTGVRSLVVVAEGRLTIFPSFDRIPRLSLSDLRRSTIDWQPHLSSELNLLSKDTRGGIKMLSPKDIITMRSESENHIQRSGLQWLSLKRRLTILPDLTAPLGSVSVGSPVVVPEKAADHTSRLNPQVHTRLQGIKTLLQNTKCCEKGKGMLRAESLSCSHNEIQPLGVVAQRLTDPYSSFSCIPEPSSSGVRRSTIDWQSHLSSEFQLLSKDIPCNIRTLSQRILTAILQIALSPVRMSKDISLIFADLGGHTAESVSNPIGV